MARTAIQDLRLLLRCAMAAATQGQVCLAGGCFSTIPSAIAGSLVPLNSNEQPDNDELNHLHYGRLV